MKYTWLIVILSLTMVGAYKISGSAAAEPETPTGVIEQPETAAPTAETPVQPPSDVQPEPVAPSVPEKPPEEIKVLPPAASNPPVIEKQQNHIPRDDDKKPDNKGGAHHDWKDNDNGKHNNNNWHQQPRPHRAPPRVVYVYPQNYYRVNRTEIYTYPAPTVATAYPDGYVPPFKAGDYLPNNRQWLVLSDYANYGLPKLRVGEQWVYFDRDVVLISTATGQILAAMTLAAPIQ